MEKPSCLVCDVDDSRLPLINLRFQGKEYWICPQHLPVLIHKPEQLVEKLPGFEPKASPPHHHD